MLKLLITALLCSPLIGSSQILTTGANISITKSWSQQPGGYTYPTAVAVPPGAVPPGGFPVCILLHGNGGNGQGMINQFDTTLKCHILVAPTGYQNSWNICAENSDAPDTEMINDLVNNLQVYTNVNQNKIRILGSSNGAGLANRIFIENDNEGIDIICAIVSHLNEPQYHSGAFYKPAGATTPASAFCGYNTLANPRTSRKYLSISNDNDNLIPYLGGTSVVGVSFLPAETAAFSIAKHKGYTGSLLTSGLTSGNPAITEFSYLAGAVVHIKGNAMHSANATQKTYIKNYFSDCNLLSGIGGINNSTSIEIFPNPAGKNLNLKVIPSLTGSDYTIHNALGIIVLYGKINSENINIDISNLPKGIYLLRIGKKLKQVFKIVKQ